MDEDPVAEAGVEIEEEALPVDVRRDVVRIAEGVTGPSIHHGHVTAPHAAVQH